MKTVNIAELKDRLSYYLNEVKAGREVLIRDRNTPVAIILPIARVGDHDDELQALAAQGKIRLAGKPLDDSLWDLPAPRVKPEALRRALDRERDEA